MKNRIKQIRKEFKLNQENFGRRIGIGKTSVSKLENGENNPSDQTLLLICQEFNINEKWLKTGEGEMFQQMSEQEKLMKYTALLLKDDDSIVASAIQALIVTYEQLDDASKSVLEKIALPYIENLKSR